ncbi:DUF4114 domain-containing protein [Egbenema bharatensis]|uniref:DUF4114 domain-containing protein n=1 Tax=Egbenema bharatensis TaxID=3463334 RepID=UPI003A8C3AEB
MKNLLTTGFALTTTLAGLLSVAAPANAFSWNNSWTQPTVQTKAETGFDDTPFQQFVQAERVALPNIGQFVLNPEKLFLKFDHEVMVYFINEGAGYRNQLAFEATGATNATGLVFNDISSPESILSESNGALRKGDGVSLGTISGGTQLDFWLRANGFNGGTNIFGTQTESNLDRLQHVVAYAYQNFIILGFEDLYGALGATGIDPLTGKMNERSDRDFNDVVVVIDIGTANLNHLMGVPEPSTVLALTGMTIVGIFGLRRKAKPA